VITAFKRALRKLTPLEVASRELAEAELQSLSAQTAVEYANSVVAYNAQRIKRLRSFIGKQTTDEVAT
jgi:hypothetical protein